MPDLLIELFSEEIPARMQARAAELGADAIVAVDLDYEAISSDKSCMLMVSANGTAVKLA